MRVFLAGTLLALALAVAGCGGGGSPSSSGGNGEAAKSAQQVLTDTVKAADAASSFHISGQISAAQQVGLDLTIVKGKGATGSFTLKGNKVDLVIIGTDAYMKADAAFFTQFAGSSGGTIAQLAAGKWLKFSTTDPQFGQLTGIASSKSIFDAITSSHGKLKNKGATTYQGQSVVDIYGGSKNGDFYVAATGTAYPVALAKSGSGAHGSVTFDNWNKSVTLTAPSGAIDISQLMGSG